MTLLKKEFRNLRMQEAIERGECIDLSECERTPEGYYILKEFTNDVDYCDAEKESWIWSIGRNYKTNEILASTGNQFYENIDYECLFLR